MDMLWNMRCTCYEYAMESAMTMLSVCYGISYGRRQYAMSMLWVNRWVSYGYAMGVVRVCGEYAKGAPSNATNVP